MHLHAYGKSGLEFATNERVIFLFFAFEIKISGGNCDQLSPLK